MANFEDKIIQNINSLVYLLHSKGIKALSVLKFLFLLNRNYHIEIDKDGLAEVLSQNKAVTDIIDDRIIIDGQVQQDEENVNKDVHDKAVDQAGENINNESKEYNEVLKLCEHFAIGKVVSAKSIKLPKEDNNYFIHQGAIKAKSNYIVTEVKPCLKLDESYVRFQIENKPIFIDIPLTTFKK